MGALPIVAFYVWDGPPWTTLGLSLMTPLLMALPHKGLHWVGHGLCGVRVRLDIVRGAFGWPTLAIQGLEPQTVQSYRFAVILPALILGLGPILLGMWLGSQVVLLIGLAGPSMASRDLAGWFQIRQWPDRALPSVRDHPTEVSVLRVNARDSEPMGSVDPSELIVAHTRVEAQVHHTHTTGPLASEPGVAPSIAVLLLG